MPLVYFWQDAGVVLVFALLDFGLNCAWIGWTVYGLSVAYVAINVPLMRHFDTPLTWPMLGAAGSALADSIRYYLTWSNLLLIGTVLLAGVGLPAGLSRRRLKIAPLWILLACVAILVGSAMTGRLETDGLHRDALWTLATSALPRISAQAADADWRKSPFPSETATPNKVRVNRDDLQFLRGRAAGLNVMMILLESTGAQYLKLYGAEEDPMPSLTKLATHALVFNEAYAVYPESIKGLFSVLCSRYPAMDSKAEDCAHIHTPALPSQLLQAGYRTALFHSGRFMYLGMNAVVQNRGYQCLEDAGAISGHFNSSFGAKETATVRRILGWIDSMDGHQPFFVTYLPIAGHHPYASATPGPFPEAEELGRYRNALHEGDAALGALMAGLRQRGLFDRTLFIIFGDHGEAFGQHDGNYGHTEFLFEENVRVPYLIAAESLFQKTRRVDLQASLIDTAPTILALLGLPIPAAFQGRPLLASQPSLALFCTDYSLGLAGLRDERWKFIYDFDSCRCQLYDLWTDIGERSNVALQQPARVAAYRAWLQAWSAAQKALCQAAGIH